MGKVRHTYDSITLAVTICMAAMGCALLTVHVAMADFSGPSTTGDDALVLKIFGIVLGSVFTSLFILAACAALADGRRTINSPSDLESLMD